MADEPRPALPLPGELLYAPKTFSRVHSGSAALGQRVVRTYNLVQMITDKHPNHPRLSSVRSDDSTIGLLTKIPDPTPITLNERPLSSIRPTDSHERAFKNLGSPSRPISSSTQIATPKLITQDEITNTPAIQQSVLQTIDKMSRVNAPHKKRASIEMTATLGELEAIVSNKEHLLKNLCKEEEKMLALVQVLSTLVDKKKEILKDEKAEVMKSVKRLSNDESKE